MRNDYYAIYGRVWIVEGQEQEVIPDNQKMSMAWKTMEWCNISKVGIEEG